MQPEQPNAEGFAPLLPPIVSQDLSPVATEKPLRLRPLWVGIVLALVGFVLSVFMLRNATDEDGTRGIIALCAAPAWIYYFMVVHRIVRLLDEQPGWSVEYTPAAAVWKHFIPFYGVYFLYVWPRDVESYVNWRLGQESRVGVWTFLGLLIGLLLRFADTYVGLLVMFVSLYVLYMPLKRALTIAVPTDVPAPGYNGTLGLR